MTDLANHDTDLASQQQEATTHQLKTPSEKESDLGVKDLAVGGEGLLERIVVGGPGEAADEATVLHVRRRHLPFHKNPKTEDEDLVRGGGEANPPLREHGGARMPYPANL